MDFTVIIPAKNEEKNIQACLQSISNIDYPADKYEVLLIDNGSTDRTVEIAESFGAIVSIQPELTISGLRNFGATFAKGKILAFLDADCTVDRDWLKAASLYLDNHEVVSFGSPAILPPNATWVQRAWFNVREKKSQVVEVGWHESANVFVLKEAFHSVGGFDKSLVTCEDYDLSFRLGSLGKQLSDSRILAIHHREPATIKEFFRKESWRGKSNISGIFKHGIHLRELPSLLFPFVYLFCIISTLLMVFGVLVGVKIVTFWTMCGWLLLWQFPLMVLALNKGTTSVCHPLRLGLYFLLNIYFLSRANAMLRNNVKNR